MLITFEGIEGCGKTTQIDLLGDHLVRQGYSVVKTREPGGTSFGEALRKLLLTKDMNVGPMCELMVFMAMRAQHMDEVILPAIKEGQIILCDRFTDATYAYQGSGRKIETQVIDALNAMVTKGIRPNLTVLLDISVEKGLKRRAAASDMDRIEAEEISFHQRVRKAYGRLAKEDPKRFFVVDANLKIDTIHDLIKTKVGNTLKSYGV